MANIEEIENIRKSANIVDIISSYLPLTQKGKNYFGVCPFHEDHSPSMSVSVDKQIYKCFSCGAAGNVFTFVKDYENCSFLEAVKIVADKCGLNFATNIKKNENIPNKELYDIMNLALKFYQNNLNSSLGKNARAYLLERNLDEEAIKDFDLGLADTTSNLSKLLISKKYDIASLIDLGLVKRNGEYLNDLFINRIIFPIHDIDGNPIGFTGRVYTASNQAKYLNSKESLIFKKGQILFNYHRAISEIKKKKEIIIVEGNMDAIRMYESGFKNTVALMGTSLTKDQVNIIKNLRSKVILMFDNDDAGEIATIQNGDILFNAGINPLVVRLSGEKDPDEYIIKNGSKAMENNLKSPLTFLDFKLKYYKKNKDLSKTEDLVSYVKSVINSIKDIPDELTRDLTLKKISTEYDIPLDTLNKELTKNIKVEKKEENKPKTIVKSNLTKYDIAARDILYFMMNDGIYIENFKKSLGYFEIKKYRSIANAIIYYYSVHNNIELSDFISYAGTQEVIYEDVMDIIKNNNIENMSIPILDDLIKVCIKETRKKEIKNLKEAIKNELDENKKMELANKLIEIKKGCVLDE